MNKKRLDKIMHTADHSTYPGVWIIAPIHLGKGDSMSKHGEKGQYQKVPLS